MGLIVDLDGDPLANIRPQRYRFRFEDLQNCRMKLLQGEPAPFLHRNKLRPAQHLPLIHPEPKSSLGVSIFSTELLPAAHGNPIWPRAPQLMEIDCLCVQLTYRPRYLRVDRKGKSVVNVILVGLKPLECPRAAAMRLLIRAQKLDWDVNTSADDSYPTVFD